MPISHVRRCMQWLLGMSVFQAADTGLHWKIEVKRVAVPQAMTRAMKTYMTLAKDLLMPKIRRYRHKMEDWTKMTTRAYTISFAKVYIWNFSTWSGFAIACTCLPAPLFKAERSQSQPDVKAYKDGTHLHLKGQSLQLLSSLLISFWTLLPRELGPTVAINISQSSHHSRKFDTLLAINRNPTAMSGRAKKMLNIAYIFGAWVA